MDLSMATCNAEKAALKSTEYRKVIKPLLERRRRARINSCLDELKALILESAQNENTDASKLEKADILELTVQHLRSLRRQSRAWPPTPALKTVDDDKFRAGFAECAQEVSTYISTISGGLDTEIRSRLLGHLAHCINRMPAMPPPNAATTPSYIPVMTSAVPPTPFRGMQQLSTPTPPPSPVSPLQTCGTPTCSSTDYVVPVSPVTPTEPYGAYGSYVTVSGDVYVWPSSEPAIAASSPSSRCSVSRSSSVDTQNSSDEYFYERSCATVSPSYAGSKVVRVDADHCGGKPWRPW